MQRDNGRIKKYLRRKMILPGSIYLPLWDQDYSDGGWDWLNGGKEFLWASEKDGWRHLYGSAGMVAMKH